MYLQITFWEFFGVAVVVTFSILLGSLIYSAIKLATQKKMIKNTLKMCEDSTKDIKELNIIIEAGNKKNTEQKNNKSKK